MFCIVAFQKVPVSLGVTLAQWTQGRAKVRVEFRCLEWELVMDEEHYMALILARKGL